MSRVKHSIALCPWNFDTPNAEHLQQGGFRCPTCSGNGAISDYFDEDRFKPCKRCNGTGHLMAEITIKWKPDDSSITS